MAKKKHPAKASKKSAPTKKPPAKKPVPSRSKSVKPIPKKPSKPAPAPPPPKAEKPAKAKKPVKAAPQPAVKGSAPVKGSARDLLRNRILGKAKSAKPIAFSLDEVREIAKTVTDKAEKTDAIKPTKGKTAAKIELSIKNAKPHHVKAASLADILGFNPRKARPADPGAEDVPEKFRRYYKLLIELRNHLTGQLDQHTEDTLKRSAKEDSGDLSSYGQHMADAGTDTFDRDFALSLVSNEQEALSEVEAAIQRIKAGTYGVCEISQKPIAKERLLAVPFTRYSAEAQKQLERNRHRSRTQAGLFGEMGEDGPKANDDGDDD